MPKSFDVPVFYRAPGIAALKVLRDQRDPKRKVLTPDDLRFQRVTFRLARHFGFCFGVENAIHIAYRAIAENEGKRIFLLSEMIHNPDVNGDLRARGVNFLMDTKGERKIPFETLSSSDVVIIPAFGTTIEIFDELSKLGVDIQKYDTTCPFVQKVWKRASELGNANFTVIVHGKPAHEETRATFSHSQSSAPTLVVRDMNDTLELVAFINGERTLEQFWDRFEDAVSDGFDPSIHFQRIGVVNQTTMLASETHAIALAIRQGLERKYGTDALSEHFADTRDTLCYATYENQTATQRMIDAGADLAIVVGGYNSSNTSHLVELCELAFPTFYIKDAGEVLSPNEIRHFDIHQSCTRVSSNWLPLDCSEHTVIAITSGASCPDALIEAVIQKIARFFDEGAQVVDAVKGESLPAPSTDKSSI